MKRKATRTTPVFGMEMVTPVNADAYIRKLIEDERAFLEPEEWGIDLRPVIREQLDPPASADDLSDEDVAEHLSCMIHLMAQHHFCLGNTNHLTDRQLYKFIIDEILPRPIGIGPNPVGGILYHECCPCDDFPDWLRWYATDDEREFWAAELDEPVVEKAPLASDRDIWISTLAEAYRDRPLP